MPEGSGVFAFDARAAPSWLGPGLRRLILLVKLPMKLLLRR